MRSYGFLFSVSRVLCINNVLPRVNNSILWGVITQSLKVSMALTNNVYYHEVGFCRVNLISDITVPINEELSPEVWK